MKKRLAAIAVALAASLGGIIAAAAPASATHPETVVVVDALAVVCGTSHTSIDSGSPAGACVRYTDAVWGASGAAVCMATADCTSGYRPSTALYAPGFGQPMGVDASPPGPLEGVPCPATGGAGCNSGWKFDSASGTCLAVTNPGLLLGPQACATKASGTLGAGASGVGAYAGSSGGSGSGTLAVAGGPAVSFTIGWDQSAATLLPLTGQVTTGHPPTGKITGLVSSRGNITECANASNQPAPRGGFNCFSVVGFVHTAP